MVIVADRLRPQTFRLPVEKIRAGYKSDIYFGRTKYVLEKDGRRDRVTMQVFQKHPLAVEGETIACHNRGGVRLDDNCVGQQRRHLCDADACDCFV
ncbi:MAG: hypothetical protein NVS9B15_19990 [Acidobacteriaceae bacterium]